ncbi:hypothetical protein HELRODRAFT_177745 [Helobdella robusta]|uniref:WSC domain-containing protein n=1 Tax=Helobdella robusta TaxID=6412 RepID=T1FC64_HELRO|nr:hypothetical protein HELRODRAFT_177745 [Helobdella robusta]ESN97690.1 hypothetical protein HELRODRAFT_177745 [Helobdella robusta]
MDFKCDLIFNVIILIINAHLTRSVLARDCSSDNGGCLPDELCVKKLFRGEFIVKCLGPSSEMVLNVQTAHSIYFISDLFYIVNGFNNNYKLSLFLFYNTFIGTDHYLANTNGKHLLGCFLTGVTDTYDFNDKVLIYVDSIGECSYQCTTPYYGIKFINNKHQCECFLNIKYRTSMARCNQTCKDEPVSNLTLVGCFTSVTHHYKAEDKTVNVDTCAAACREKSFSFLGYKALAKNIINWNK